MDGTVARNKPCPCGSGKKYKLCHGATTPAAPPPSDQRGAIAQRLLRALYAERKGALDKAFRAFMEPLSRLDRDQIAPFMQTESTQSAINSYALYDLEGKDGRTFAERFLHHNARTLAAADVAYIETLLGSFVDFYEVRRVHLGRGFDLRNLRNGNDVFVHERLATEKIVTYDVLAARVLEMEPGRVELFPPVLQFNQTEGRDVLADVKRVSRGAPRSGLDVRNILKLALPLIHARWVASHLMPSLRNLRTSEGEALEPTRVEFRLPDRARAIAALDASDAFERDADDDDRRYAFLGRAGSGQLGEGRLLLGNVEVGERSLVGEVMARSRAARLKAALSAADAGAFEFVSESSTDIEDLAKAERERRDAQSDAGVDGEIDPMQIPEVAQRMAAFEEQWRRKWLDEPIPALSGRTPREAARSRTLRPRVIALLKEFEVRSERARRQGRPAYDASWMWKELDLQP